MGMYLLSLRKKEREQSAKGLRVIKGRAGNELSGEDSI